MAAASLTRTSRQPGERPETGALRVAAGERSCRLTADLDLLDLQDPVNTLALEIWESLDNGATWKFAAGCTDRGAVARTSQPWVQLHDSTIAGRLVKGVLIPGRAMSAGALLESLS